MTRWKREPRVTLARRKVVAVVRVAGFPCRDNCDGTLSVGYVFGHRWRIAHVPAKEPLIRRYLEYWPALRGATPLERSVEPPGGFREGYERVMRGRCPYCGQRMTDPVVVASGLSWGCYDGCNP